MNKLLTKLTLSSLTLMAGGCQQNEQPNVDAELVAPVDAKPAAEPAAEAGAAIDPVKALREAMASYVAPFPERTNMFVPPKDAPRSSSAPLTEGDVQLRGLVNVGEPRAILDIEGATALVGVGDEKFGVRVVSIDDRRVVLERGATQWTASLD